MEKEPVGWKCPECSKIISPYVTMCPHCEEQKRASVKKVAGGKETKDGMIKESNEV